MGDYEERRRAREERRKMREAGGSAPEAAPAPAPAAVEAADAEAKAKERRARREEKLRAAAGGAPSEEPTPPKPEEKKEPAVNDDADKKRKEEEEAAAAAAAAAEEEKRKQEAAEEERRKQEAAEEEERRKEQEAAEEEERRRKEQEAEEERRREEEEEEKRREEEEENRRKEEAEAEAAAAAAAEEENRRKEAEAAAAEEERKRKEQEASSNLSEEDKKAAERKARREARLKEAEQPAPAPAAAAAAAPAPEVAEDSYEARQAARAARRAARDTKAMTIAAPPSNPVTSPPPQRKESAYAPGVSLKKLTSKENLKAESQADPMMKKEFEADDLAAIAERKRIAVQQKEEERKRQLEQMKKSPSQENMLKKSTSQDTLKNLPKEETLQSPTLTRKSTASALTQPSPEPERKPIKKLDTTKFEQPAQTEEPKARARPVSSFVPSTEPKAVPKPDVKPKPSRGSPAPDEPKPAEPSPSPASQPVDEAEQRRLEREKRRAQRLAETEAPAPAPASAPQPRVSRIDRSTFEKPAEEEPARKPRAGVPVGGSLNPAKLQSFLKSEGADTSNPPVVVDKPARGSVFNRTFEQPTAAEKAAPKPTDFPASKQSRIVVTTGPRIPPGGATVSVPALSSPLFMFSTIHKDLREALIDFINLKLGSDVQLLSMKVVPLTNANFINSLKNGVIICKLVNAVSKNTLDERTINMTNLNDNERVIENFHLGVNSARSVGCAITAKAEDLAAGNAKALEDVAWQVVKAALRKRIRIEYEASGRDKCAMCGSRIDDQHGQKGSIRICMSCIDVPLNFVNFFTGENSMETNEMKAKTADPGKKANRATIAH